MANTFYTAQEAAKRLGMTEQELKKLVPYSEATTEAREAIKKAILDK